MAAAGAFEGHAAGIVADLADGLDILWRQRVDLWQGGEFVELFVDALGSFVRFLDESGHHAFHGALREIPQAGELLHGEAVFLCDGADFFQFFTGVLHPASGAEGAVVAIAEGVAGMNVVMENAAVIDDSGEDVHAVFFCCRQDVLAGPGLQRIEDDHRPVHAVAKALKAIDHVQREAVGWAWGDPETVGETLGFKGGHGIPDDLACVGDGVWIVQKEAVKLRGLAALQGLLCGHRQVTFVFIWAAQAGLRKAWVALGPSAQAGVEIVTDDADEAVFIAGDALQGFAQHGVRTTGAVDIRGDEGTDALIEGLADHFRVALIVQHLAEVHKFAAAPGAVGCTCDVHGLNE